MDRDIIMRSPRPWRSWSEGPFISTWGQRWRVEDGLRLLTTRRWYTSPHPSRSVPVWIAVSTRLLKKVVSTRRGAVERHAVHAPGDVPHVVVISSSSSVFRAFRSQNCPPRTGDRLLPASGSLRRSALVALRVCPDIPDPQSPRLSQHIATDAL